MKHVDWCSRLILTGDRFLRNLTNESSCLIDVSDIRIAGPYNSFTTLDALDTVIANDNQPNTHNRVLCTEVESHQCTSRQTMAIIRRHSSRPPRFKSWLDKFQVSRKLGFLPNMTYAMSYLSTHVSRKYHALFRRPCQNPIPNIAHVLNHSL